jgi:hypothetical protein
MARARSARHDFATDLGSAMRLNSTKHYAERRRDINDALDAYIDWRGECEAAQDAYRAWRGAPSVDAALAFDAYQDALDREDQAANAYAGLITRVARLACASLAPHLAAILPGAGGRPS